MLTISYLLVVRGDELFIGSIYCCIGYLRGGGGCLVGVQQGQSYLMGEGASLALVSHPFSDDVTIKMPYGVDVLLQRPDSHTIFSYWVG